MRKSHIILAAIAVVSFWMFPSCEKEGGNVTNISQPGGHSHNAGENCMNCHSSGGEGKGWFVAAGTVYNGSLSATYPNTVVNLYTQPNGGGDLKATLYGDSRGNFFTTAGIDFSAGLYPAVTGTTGITDYMTQPITQGACNSCHGVSQIHIWAE